MHICRLLIACMCVAAPHVFAAENAQPQPNAPTPAQEQKEEEHKPADPDTGKSTLSSDTLGLVPDKYDTHGLKLTLTYVGETLSNVSGGLKRGTIYEGRLNTAFDVDFETLAGWRGLTFHANVFQIHGHGLSRNYVGNLMLVSSIEALQSTRLYEAWLEQKFADNKWSLRAGQLAADTEFITSRYTDVFINSTYGWPTITGANLPSGGPSPPLAAVGARVKYDFNENNTLLAAVFNGNSAGPGVDDPQQRNRAGLNFRVNDAPLALAEYQYTYNSGKNARGLPGALKIGAWYHTGSFNDQRFASNGVSQAAPNAATTPAQHRPDYGIYSVLDQMVVRFGGKDATRGIGTFVRASTSPSDRNLIDLYVDGGVTVIGAARSRPNDKLGLGFAYARISDRARALDRDFGAFGVDTRPVRDYEALFVLSYLAEIRTGWTVLPTLQYVIHPGAGYALQSGTPRPVSNSVVVGVRTVLKF